MGIPIFTGGRISAEIARARAAFERAGLNLALVRELASVDTADALLDLEAARSTWTASSGTVDQAMEAHRIAEIRFSEGISTQLELSDSQLALQQARANRAVAERDLRLAELRLALLEHLPLTPGGTLAQPGAAALPVLPQAGAPSVPSMLTPSGPMQASSPVPPAAGAAGSTLGLGR